jgi:hypothetical protein
MTPEQLSHLLLAFKADRLSHEEVLRHLATPLGHDLDFARLDLHRSARTGIPEVIYGEGKSASQIAAILQRMHDAGHVAIATRVDEAKAREVLHSLPALQHHGVARVLVWPVEALAEPRAAATPDPLAPQVALLCAGTSDLPVLEEAAVVLEALGHPVLRFKDVGVAGLHRLLEHVDALRACRVLIAVAGMEGALPSVVAGLVGRPVIAVPTSVGYGVAFGGIAPLLGMLNACAPGVAVVNIDNGFGAAAMAALMLRP